MKSAKTLIQEYILARTICVYYSDNLVIYAQYMCSKVALIQRCSQEISNAIDIYNDKYEKQREVARGIPDTL